MKKSSLFLALLALCVFLGGCGKKQSAFEKTRFDLFDTVCVIRGYAKSRAEFEKAAAVCWAELEACHKALDAYNEYDGLNNLCAVNRRAAEAPVKADGRLLEVLMLLKNAPAEALAYVNPALGPVTELWREARETGGPPPSAEALAACARHIDFSRVILNAEEGTVFFADEGMKLDLGAVGKGYAAMKAAQALAAEGTNSMLINLGGSVTAVGAPADGRTRWTVGIQKPFSADLIDTVSLKDQSAVTSGSYQRYFTYEGENYHHLIDPETLMPGGSCLSVTIVGDDPFLCDLYSTAAFFMPPEEGALLAKSAGMESVWVLEDGAVFKTEQNAPRD